MRARPWLPSASKHTRPRQSICHGHPCRFQLEPDLRRSMSDRREATVRGLHTMTWSCGLPQPVGRSAQTLCCLPVAAAVVSPPICSPSRSPTGHGWEVAAVAASDDQRENDSHHGQCRGSTPRRRRLARSPLGFSTLHSSYAPTMDLHSRHLRETTGSGPKRRRRAW